MNCQEAEELITALVDNELSRPERASIEEHLRNCAACTVRYRREMALKSEIRRHGSAIKAPAELRQKILRDTRVFTLRPATREASPWAARIFTRPAFALTLIVLLLIPVLYMTRPARNPIATSALLAHEKIAAGELPMIQGATPGEIREKLIRSAGGTFAPLTYDLSRYGFKTVGGRVEQFAGRQVLVMVYEGEDGPVTCYTFLGTEADAPPGAPIFHDEQTGMNFYSYSRGGVNAVFHRAGKLICILVGKAPVADLLAIARFTA